MNQRLQIINEPKHHPDKIALFNALYNSVAADHVSRPIIYAFMLVKLNPQAFETVFAEYLRDRENNIVEVGETKVVLFHLDSFLDITALKAGLARMIEEVEQAIIGMNKLGKITELANTLAMGCCLESRARELLHYSQQQLDPDNFHPELHSILKECYEVQDLDSNYFMQTVTNAYLKYIGQTVIIEDRIPVTLTGQLFSERLKELVEQEVQETITKALAGVNQTAKFLFNLRQGFLAQTAIALDFLKLKNLWKELDLDNLNDAFKFLHSRELELCFLAWAEMDDWNSLTPELLNSLQPIKTTTHSQNPATGYMILHYLIQKIYACRREQIEIDGYTAILAGLIKLGMDPTTTNTDEESALGLAANLQLKDEFQIMVKTPHGAEHAGMLFFDLMKINDFEMAQWVLLQHKISLPNGQAYQKKLDDFFEFFKDELDGEFFYNISNALPNYFQNINGVRLVSETFWHIIENDPDELFAFWNNINSDQKKEVQFLQFGPKKENVFHLFARNKITSNYIEIKNLIDRFPNELDKLYIENADQKTPLALALEMKNQDVIRTFATYLPIKIVKKTVFQFIKNNIYDYEFLKFLLDILVFPTFAQLQEVKLEAVIDELEATALVEKANTHAQYLGLFFWKLILIDKSCAAKRLLTVLPARESLDMHPTALASLQIIQGRHSGDFLWRLDLLSHYLDKVTAELFINAVELHVKFNNSENISSLLQVSIGKLLNLKVNYIQDLYQSPAIGQVFKNLINFKINILCNHLIFNIDYLKFDNEKSKVNCFASIFTEINALPDFGHQAKLVLAALFRLDPLVAKKTLFAVTILNNLNPKILEFIFQYTKCKNITLMHFRNFIPEDLLMATTQDDLYYAALKSLTKVRRDTSSEKSLLQHVMNDLSNDEEENYASRLSAFIKMHNPNNLDNDSCYDYPKDMIRHRDYIFTRLLLLLDIKIVKPLVELFNSSDIFILVSRLDPIYAEFWFENFTDLTGCKLTKALDVLENPVVKKTSCSEVDFKGDKDVLKSFAKASDFKYFSLWAHHKMLAGQWADSPQVPRLARS